MATWNFRVIKHDMPNKEDIWFGLHEVYNKKGEIEKWTQNALLVGNSFEDLETEVNHIVNDLKRFPEALNYSDLAKQKG